MVASMLPLGVRAGDGASAVGLPTEALLRHVLALGSRGSGKSVFCKVVVEEAVRAGIPVIAVDPQGDLVSLALFGDEAELARRGADPRAAREFHERAEVVVFTPASRRGIPLCADPVHSAPSTVGARRMLFTGGVPIDAETLLGLGPHRTPGRVRVSIIYLGTLHSQDDKDLIVAALADRLYRWMLQHPCKEPQALLYVDEVAPFVPPARKPACKEGLTVLLEQARKYGVGCMMATQNPCDVDHRAMGQFGTWALGRLSARQDIAKIEPSLRALAPDDADAIAARLPQLRPGELVLVSPDHHPEPVPLITRWLYSDHRTIDETGLAEIVTADQRARFAPLVKKEMGNEDPTRSVVSAPARPEAPTPVPPPPEEPIPFAGDAAEAFSPSAPTLLVSADGVVDRRDEPGVRWARKLAQSTSMTAKEFAERAEMSVAKARRVLGALIESGDAGRYKEGRSYRYWATSNGARPDLSLPDKVSTVAAALGQDDAEKLGEQAARGKLLGFIGDAERFESAELVHRLLYRVDFDEKVPAPILSRFLGGPKAVLAGSVYLHPSRLDVLVLSEKDGMSFVANPKKHVSAVEDLDGVAAFVDVPPGTLTLEESDWESPASQERVRARFAELFEARARAVSPVLIPLWRLSLTAGGGKKKRLVLVDAVVGRPVTWD